MSVSEKQQMASDFFSGDLSARDPEIAEIVKTLNKEVLEPRRKG